jgi:hypothetical protein
MLLAPLIILIAALSAWLIYKWTVYALPWLVGWYAAGFAFGTGAGWLGSFLVWGLTALFVCCLMRWLYGVAGAPVVPTNLVNRLCRAGSSDGLFPSSMI